MITTSISFSETFGHQRFILIFSGIAAVGALLVIFGFMLKQVNKPKIRVIFPNKSKKNPCCTGEQKDLCFQFENTGKRPITNISFFIHFPKSIKILGESVHQAPLVGRFANLQYISFENKISMFQGEIEEQCVKITMPDKAGLYPVYVALLSKQIESYVEELTLDVT